MPRVDMNEWDDTEPENFRKISRISATNGRRRDRGITPASRASRGPKLVRDRPIETLRFLSDDPKIKHLDDAYVEGFTDLGLIFNHDAAMAEFDIFSNESDIEDCLVDTSFMMKPSMPQGTHPEYGILELCEPVFLHVLTNCFQGSEDYKGITQEIRRTNKAHTKALRSALENPYVFTTPQVVFEIANGINGFKEQLRTHIQKGHTDYAVHLRERVNRLQLISDILELNQDTREKPLVRDLELKERLYEFCQRSSSERRNDVTIAGNNLVAYTMARVMEIGEPQRILTRSSRVTSLVYGIANPTIGESFEIPGFELESSYNKSPRLHNLRLSLK